MKILKNSFLIKNFINTNSYLKTNLFKFSLNRNLLQSQFKQFSTVYVNHRDTEDNNEKAPFDFTEENYKEVEKILVSFIDFSYFYLNISLFFSLNTLVIKKNLLLCHYST